MEIKRSWVVISILILLILAGVIVFTLINSDREGPQIEYPAEDVLYKEGEDTTPLLEGVTAYDEQEGDVSETLIVENIITLSSETEAKVVYAAKDSHNNITKVDRSIQYEPLPEPVAVEDTTDPAAREAAVRVAQMIAEQYRNAPTVSENIVDEADTEGEEETEPEERFNGIVAGAAAVTEKTDRTEEPVDEPEPEPEDEPAAEPEQQAVTAPSTQAAQPTPAADAPKIALSTKTISMYQGDAFNPYAFIASAIDNGVDVTHTVKTTGSVDATKVGSYTITYYAVDADGHKSNTESLQVQVIPRP